jgi:hypothetical protein
LGLITWSSCGNLYLYVKTKAKEARLRFVSEFTRNLNRENFLLNLVKLRSTEKLEEITCAPAWPLDLTGDLSGNFTYSRSFPLINEDKVYPVKLGYVRHKNCTSTQNSKYLQYITIIVLHNNNYLYQINHVIIDHLAAATMINELEITRLLSIKRKL